MKRFIVLWMLILMVSITFTAQTDQTHSVEQEVVALACVDGRPVVEDELTTVQVLICFEEQEVEVVPGIVCSSKNDFESVYCNEVLRTQVSLQFLVSLQLTTNLLNEYMIILSTRDLRFLPKWLMRSPKGHKLDEIALLNSNLY